MAQGEIFRPLGQDGPQRSSSHIDKKHRTTNRTASLEVWQTQAREIKAVRQSRLVAQGEAGVVVKIYHTIRQPPRLPQPVLEQAW